MQCIAEGQQPIALLEAAMFPFCLIIEHSLFANREVLWFVDNTSALGSMIKGASKQPILERIVALFWSLSCRLRTKIWIEFVDSESNWADGISCDCALDSFALKHGFSTRRVHMDFSVLGLDYVDLWEYTKIFA